MLDVGGKDYFKKNIRLQIYPNVSSSSHVKLRHGKGHRIDDGHVRMTKNNEWEVASQDEKRKKTKYI